jgi:PAS domain S-box-containing protein
MKPAFFMESPVYTGGDLIGAVVFSFDVGAIDHILAIQSNEDNAEGRSVFMLGNDLLYRSTDPSLSADPVKFLRKLKRNSTLAGEYENASRLGTTVLVQTVDRGKFGAALAGKEGQIRYTTETGQDVLCSFEPFEAGGQHFILVSQVDLSGALRPVKRLIWFMTGISILLILLTYVVVHFLSDRLSARIVHLTNALGSIGSYREDDKIEKGPADEIGSAVGKALEIDNRVRNATGTVLKMAAGEIDSQFEAAGDDVLAKALLKLKDSLISQREADLLRKQADEILNWSSKGIAMFNEILRTDNDNMERLCLNIIRNLIQYLSANQGGMFLTEEDEGKRYLNLTAAYAYDRQKFIQKRIGLGEGLAGTCALEKKTILLSRIPDNYIEITSGLGGAKPGCILIVPLKKEEEVLGVIEIASFDAFKPHEVEFAEKVAESIASALITVQLHLQTSLYLERFRQQAEEMKAQDEELRQNIEELQATHEQMERMKQEEEEHNRLMVKDAEDFRKLLLMVLDQIPGKIFLKDHNGALLLLNSAVAKVYSKSVDELIGTTDFDNHPMEDARVYREKELEIINKGPQTYIQEESLTGDVKYLKTTKMPFYLPHLGKTGLLGIQLDVTDFVKMELQNKEKEKELELNQQLFIDILDKVPAKIFLKDENGVFVVVNSAVSSVYNKTVNEIIGTSDYDNHPEDDVDSWRKQELDIMEKGENQYVHAETIQGVTRHLKTLKMPFRIITRGTTGLLGIQFDITREKELEEAVKRQGGDGTI